MLLCGFFIAKAFETHQLHRRITLVLIDHLGRALRKDLILGPVTIDGWITMLGVQLALIGALPLSLPIVLVILFMTFITEINSNTATATIFLPVLATMALAGGTHPLLLMIPATFACSCAFMLPSGTGPNAVISGLAQSVSAVML